MRVHLQELLETRLRLTQAWSGPSQLNETSVIERPIFITGIPRSGSTFLQELLAEDPENRAPRAWEVMFPIPTGSRRPREVDPRIRKANSSLWWFRRLAPAADSVYPIRAWTPHECVALASRPRRLRPNSFEVRHLLYGRKPHVYRIIFTVEGDRVYILYASHGHRSLFQSIERQQGNRRRVAIAHSIAWQSPRIRRTRPVNLPSIYWPAAVCWNVQ